MRAFVSLLPWLFLTACPLVPDAADSGPEVELATDGGPTDGGDDDVLDAGSPAEDAGINDAGPPPLCPSLRQHNGGDGRCVPLGGCSIGYFLREDGRCTAWRPVQPLPTDPFHPSIVVDGNRIYSLCNGVGTGFFTTLANGELGPWEPVEPLPRERILCQAAAIDGRIIVVGGKEDFGDARDAFVADILEDGRLSSWVVVPNVIQIPRTFAALYPDGDRLIYGGGSDDSPFGGPTALEDISVLNGVPSLSTLFADLPAVTWFLTLASASGRLYATGDDGISETWAFSSELPGLLQWSQESSGGPEERLCFASDGQHLFALGGGLSLRELSHTVDSVYVGELGINSSSIEWKRVGALDHDVLDAQCVVVAEYLLVLAGKRRPPHPDAEYTSTRLVSIARIDAVLRSVEAP